MFKYKMIQNENVVGRLVVVIDVNPIMGFGPQD
jgi:hypothetical protein